MPLHFFQRKKGEKETSDLRALDRQACDLGMRFVEKKDPADLDLSISIFEDLVVRTPPEDESFLRLLQKLVMMLAYRYIESRQLADVERQNELQERVVAMIPVGSAEYDKQFHKLEIVQSELAKRKAGPAGYVSEFERAVEKLAPGSPDRPKMLFGLGQALARRSVMEGAQDDMDRAIGAFREAGDSAPAGMPHLSEIFAALGKALLIRHTKNQDPADLDGALDATRRATGLVTAAEPGAADCYNDRGVALQRQHESRSDPAALAQAVAAFERSLELTPPGLNEQAGRQANLERARAQLAVLQAEAAAPALHERPAARPWRELRVFISSTFRDMHAERDHLVRFVFPRLREALRPRRVHLVDVDLRWGVTADEDAFERCMDEIERCYPRFLCMLGGRYGWVPLPDRLDRNVLEKILEGDSPAGVLNPKQKDLLISLYLLEPGDKAYRMRPAPPDAARAGDWQQMTNRGAELLLRAGLDGLRSITAAEVLHGALNRPDVPTFRYFHFRDPQATASVPAEHAPEYAEPAGSGAANALEDLKVRIAGSRGAVPVTPDKVSEQALPVHEYTCTWDAHAGRFVDLEAFGEAVYADLLASVDAEYDPLAGGETPPLVEARFAADAFVEDLLGTYQAAGGSATRECFVAGSRRTLLDAMLEHVRGDSGNGILCLVGPTGSGKSALAAKFHCELSSAGGDERVFLHFTGVNATGRRDLLFRLCSELSAWAGETGTVPLDADGLKGAFPRLLEQACVDHRVVLLLDGIDQVEREGALQPLDWLPEGMPAGARVILSAAPGPALEELRARGAPPEELRMEPLTREDAAQVAAFSLQRYRKNLTEEQLQALLAKPGVDTPLFLVTALEELRTLGTYELTPRIQAMPGDLRSLFGWILERLEQDPGFRDASGKPVGRQLVSAFCTSLGAARSGLTEPELVALASPGDLQGNAAALQRLLRPYLARRGERLEFSHTAFRDAVQVRYLSGDAARRDAHRRLALFFRRAGDPSGNSSWTGEERALCELPHHLTKAGEWKELAEVLTDLRFLARRLGMGAVLRTAPDGHISRTWAGIYTLLEDLDAARAGIPAGETRPAALLAAFNQALRREAHVLARNPALLWQQLYNQLQFDPDPVHALLQAEQACREKTGESAMFRVTGTRQSASLLQSLGGHRNSVKGCAVSTDGSLVVSVSLDGSAKVWDLASGQERLTLAGDGDGLLSCAISLDDRFMVTGGVDGILRVWELPSGRQRLELAGHGRMITSCAFSPDGRTLLSGHREGSLCTWDAQTGTSRLCLEADKTVVEACAFSRDGTWLVSAGWDGNLRTWDAETGAARLVLQGHNGAVLGCAVSPDGSFLVSAGEAGTLILWDALTGHQRAVLDGHNGAVTACAVSPDGSLVASCSEDNDCRIWEVRSGDLVKVLTGHASAVNAVAFSPDGSLLVSAGNDKTLKIWKMTA